MLALVLIFEVFSIFVFVTCSKRVFSQPRSNYKMATASSVEITGAVTKLPLTSLSSADPMMTFIGASFTPDGDYYAVASAKGPVYVVPTAPGGHDHRQHIWTFNPTGLSEMVATTCVRFSPATLAGSEQGEYIAATTVSNGTVHLWSIDGEKRKSHTLGAALEEGNETLVATFSPSGAKLVTAGSDKTVRVYDVNGTTASPAQSSTQASPSHSQVVPTEEPESPTSPIKPPAPLVLTRSFVCGIDNHGQDTLGPNNRIFAAHFYDENIFLVGGWETPVLLYDARSPKDAQGVFKGPHVSGNAIDTKDNLIVVGSDRQSDQIQVFDIRRMGDPVSSATVPTRLFTAKWARSTNEKESAALNKAAAVWCGGSENNAIHCVSVEHGAPIVPSQSDLSANVYNIHMNPARPEYVMASGAHGFIEHFAVQYKL